MKVMVVIPARGGSEGVPRKNIRAFAGRPLIAWSIDAAAGPHHHSGEWRTFVSTEDIEIAAVARMNGAEVIARPQSLATHTAATDPVIVHALTHVTQDGWRPDVVVLLQPTVPLRPAGLVDACVCRLIQRGADSLLTGYPLHFVWWKESGMVGSTTSLRQETFWRSQCPRRPRRQQMEDRELMFAEDGSVFVTRTTLLEETGARLGGKMELFETERSIDIDTEEDFVAAEAIMNRRINGAG